MNERKRRPRRPKRRKNRKNGKKKENGQAKGGMGTHAATTAVFFYSLRSFAGSRPSFERKKDRKQRS